MKNLSRRTFLGTAPVAAAAGLTLANGSTLSAFAAEHDALPALPAGIQLFTAQTIQDDLKALEAKPGSNNLVDGKTAPFVVMLQVEKATSAKEFEWHEGRDHVFQILDGATVYEVGGTPKGGHSKGPGEWLAPASEGAAKIAMKKGDMLVISPMGTVKP
jgi:hypothetical protein